MAVFALTVIADVRYHPFSRGFFHGELRQMQNIFLCIPRNQRYDMAILELISNYESLCYKHLLSFEFLTVIRWRTCRVLADDLFYYPVMACIR